MEIELVNKSEIRERGGKGIERKSRYKDTDEELLNRLRKFNCEKGYPPGMRDFINNPENPGFNLYIKRFGSWNKALEMAGLNIGHRKVRHTRELAIDAIKLFYKENERVPEARDFINNPKYPSSNTIIRIFGSWNKAIEIVGLKANHGGKNYTEDELLSNIVMFFDDNGYPPSVRDFTNNSLYPSFATYRYRFGSWNNALKLVGLDIDSIIKKGIIETNDQKKRLAEICVLEYFDKNEEAMDLSGIDPSAPFDGISPDGKIYDVKSSKLYIDRSRWDFGLRNKYRNKIEIYYLLAFNEDYTNLEYGWKIDENITVDIGDHLQVGMYNGIFNIENMSKYDITDKLRCILREMEL